MDNKKIKGIAGLSNESFISLFMVVVLFVIFAVSSAVVPNFFTGSNVLALLTNNWFLVVLGIGATFIVMTGNMDMSLGGIVAMAGVLVAFFCQGTDGARAMDTGLGLPFWAAAILTILCCLVIGLINAFFVAKLKVASLIITLGTASLARGIAQIVARGAQRSTNLPDSFGVIGNMYLPHTSIKLSVLIMLVFLLATLFLEKKTVFGKRTYYVGANAEAAHLSGIKTERHLGTLFVINSFLAAIVGIMLASEYLAGYSTRGEGFEFDALCITLLGGTVASGGSGSVLGAFIGALIFSIVTNAAGGLLLSPDWTYVLKAVVTFLAIVAQRYALDKRKKC